MQEKNSLFNKVLSFLYGKENRTRLDSEINSVIDHLYNLSKMDDLDQEQVLARLKEKMNIQRVYRIRRYKRIASYAAILVMVVASSALLLHINLRESLREELIITAENTPKSIRLTLGKGDVITLPEKGAVHITNSNSVLVKNVNDASLSYQSQKSNSEIEYNTLEIPRTMNYRLNLSDGSTVYLNSDTRIRFPKSFSGVERKLFLEKGEAYFEIARNEQSPFIVEVKGTNVKVLGTTFNISAYPENTTATTTLVSGKLQVTAGKQSVTLLPGTQAIENNGSFLVTAVDLSPYTSWKDGLFIFKRQTLETVLMQMHRWYDFSLVFVDPDIKDYQLTGVIDKNLPERDIFKILERTNNIRIEMETGERIVRVRKR